MCRIIAASGTKGEILSDTLKKFCALAETGIVPATDPPGHKDGWGMVAYNISGAVVVYEKEPQSAANNPKFVSAIEKTAAAEPVVVMAHLRKASKGAVIVENAQPYVWKSFSFCHNGTINDYKNFPLDGEFLKLRKGTNDSEWIFYHLAQEIRKNPVLPLEIFFRNFVEKIRPLDYTAFNALFSDGRQLIAVREANEKNSWVKENNLCDYYYTLYLGKSADGKATAVCSQKLDIEGVVWSEIPNHAFALIDLQTSEEKIVNI